MRHLISVPLVLMLSLACLVILPDRAPIQAGEDLPRFQEVATGLFRGAQPSDAGIRKLKELGVRTVIDLRGESEGTNRERKLVEASGMRFVSIPMSAFGKPSKESVKAAMRLLLDRQNAPVFVHCKHGEDRTGVIIACYRILHDKWDQAKAIEEARRMGMSRLQVGMRQFIKDFTGN